MSTIDSERIIPLMYNAEKRREKKFAKFHKCIFHMHSPASYDYRLKGNKYWKKIDNKTFLSYAKEQEIIPIEDLKEQFTLKDIKLSEKEELLFESSKEMLAYCMVAYELLKKEIALVVLTDHNSIKGFEKLQYALDKIHNQYPSLSSIHTRIILGIEVSCSDKCHVVGIFNQEDIPQIKKLKSWIEEYIMSESDGTYLSSHAVLTEFNKLGGIGYIAHINTSTLFYDPEKNDKKDKSTVSGAYKKSLFNLEFHTFFGLSTLERAEYIQDKIYEIVKKKLNYILEEDSHALDEIGTKAFWIKGQSLDFNMIYNSLKDIPGTTSIHFPNKPQSYIKSLYIDNKCFFTETGDQGGLLIPFSANMNTLIGGRGTGKSTILNILEFLISQLVENKKTLDYILKQGSICLLYCYQGIDYFIMFNSGAGDENDNIFSNQCFPKPVSWNQLYQDPYQEKELRKKVIQKRIQVYTFNEKDDKKKINEILPAQPILNQIFTRKFSIHNLVEIASDQKRTLDFILEMVFFQSDIRNGLKLSSKLKSWKKIKEFYGAKNDLLEQRLLQVNQVILPFNEKQKNKIQIVYKQLQLNTISFPWNKILNIYDTNYTHPFKGYKISNYQLINFLHDLSLKTDPIDILLKIYNQNYNSLKQDINITNYLIIDSYWSVEAELKNIDNNNIDTFFDEIKNKIKTQSSLVFDFLNDYFKHVDHFSLEFNINNRESSGNMNVLFKPIDEISMGQKVVAMLSFILEYSNFIGDTSPLIIDQPEDNLDNQYIYRNLVQDFRGIKNSRQIIIATHNSTIVINTGCENVIVLESDHKNSWISTKGYSQRKNVTHEIINKLEGGTEAFQHKIRIYKDNLSF